MLGKKGGEACDRMEIFNTEDEKDTEDTKEKTFLLCLDQSFAQGSGDRFGFGVDLEFGVDVFEVE